MNINNIMEAIIKTDNYNIYKLEKSIYKIIFENTSYSLVNSLVKSKIIMGSSTDEYYKIITFKAESVKTLHQYIHEYMLRTGKKGILISDAVKLIRSLVRQLSYLLEKTFSTILGYNQEDVIVINDETFIFLGGDLITNIDIDTELTMISCPFSSREFFFSPEMFTITELPAYVHYKTAYFSLALLVIYTLLDDNEFYSEYVKCRQPEKIVEYLQNHPIKETKLYWLLSRCLVEEPKNRSILLI